MPSRPTQKAGGRAALPDKFVSIRDLINTDEFVGRLVHVVGIVKDCRLPFRTTGTDWKMTLVIVDETADAEALSLAVNLFRPKKEDLPIVASGDVIILHSIKFQMYNHNKSLLTNRTTSWHVYSASLIPEPPAPAQDALRAPIGPQRFQPTAEEQAFVSWLFHEVGGNGIPDQDVFETRAQDSLNVKKGKFAELKDVGDTSFHDLIVQVVDDPFDLGDRISMWVSDYTENLAFFDRAAETGATHERYDDPCGYLNRFSKGTEQRAWGGPFGKMAMQMSVWEPHASCIRGQAKAGDWLHLGNVQIKYGRNNSNLEGFLREDRVFRSSRAQVAVLDVRQEPENVDPRLKEALRRKRDYERLVKKQKEYLKAENGSKKRKAVGGVPEGPQPKAKDNSLPNRKQRRALQQKMARATEQEHITVTVSDVNKQLKCESPEQKIDSLSSFVEPVFYTTTVGGDEVRLRLPFVNTKCRACVRVVDFQPRGLEDFAISRKVNEYDCLSHGGSISSLPGSCSSLSDDEEDAPGIKREWEWCFKLQLEDASPLPRGATPARIWVIVDHQDAQLLTNLDATDLRQDEETLRHLRERMFTLWGDLAEKKEAEAELRKLEPQPKNSRAGYQNRPPDSPEENHAAGRTAPKSSQIRNLPFYCCIRQYGVKMKTRQPDKMDAGQGLRWERVFGLFGTKIALI